MKRNNNLKSYKWWPKLNWSPTPPASCHVFLCKYNFQTSHVAIVACHHHFLIILPSVECGHLFQEFLWLLKCRNVFHTWESINKVIFPWAVLSPSVFCWLYLTDFRNLYFCFYFIFTLVLVALKFWVWFVFRCISFTLVLIVQSAHLY